MGFLTFLWPPSAPALPKVKVVPGINNPTICDSQGRRPRNSKGRVELSRTGTQLLAYEQELAHSEEAVRASVLALQNAQAALSEAVSARDRARSRLQHFVKLL